MRGKGRIPGVNRWVRKRFRHDTTEHLQQTFATRFDISEQHLEDDEDDEEHAAWAQNRMIVATLGADGMSSDESSREDGGQMVYWVKRLKWRAKIVSDNLLKIDSDRNTTNGYGNTRSGNPPRVRKRRNVQQMRDSVRNAPPRLPVNFYDASWYSALTTSQKRDLGAVEMAELFELE